MFELSLGNMNTAPQSEEDLNVETPALKKAALVLRALNHKLRQQLLLLIHRHHRITVSDLYKQLRLEQSLTSQHLAVLRKAGFVLAERQGKFIFYTVNYQRLKEVAQFSRNLLG